MLVTNNLIQNGLDSKESLTKARNWEERWILASFHPQVYEVIRAQPHFLNFSWNSIRVIGFFPQCGGFTVGTGVPSLLGEKDTVLLMSPGLTHEMHENNVNEVTANEVIPSLRL